MQLITLHYADYCCNFLREVIFVTFVAYPDKVNPKHIIEDHLWQNELNCIRKHPM